MKRTFLILTVLTAVLSFAVAAYATEAATDSFPVTANVVPTCTISTVGINFGDYGGLPVQAQGTIEVNCIMELEYEIALDIGQHGTLSRQMKDASTNLLNYEIFMDPGVATIWGDGCVDSPTYGSEVCAGSFTGIGSVQTYTTYGFISGSQQVPTGEYTDVVGVTVWY
jgi:spore coat protein U-like protein